VKADRNPDFEPVCEQGEMLILITQEIEKLCTRTTIVLYKVGVELVLRRLQSPASLWRRRVVRTRRTRLFHPQYDESLGNGELGSNRGVNICDCNYIKLHNL
jgi:hypothetical protein